MTKSEAIIIFDPVVCTLELALQKGMLKIQQKLIVAGEILNLINLLQSKNKIIRDLRPGILALDEHFQMKLLDFGKLNIIYFNTIITYNAYIVYFVYNILFINYKVLSLLSALRT